MIKKLQIFLLFINIFFFQTFAIGAIVGPTSLCSGESGTYTATCTNPPPGSTGGSAEWDLSGPVNQGFTNHGLNLTLSTVGLPAGTYSLNVTRYYITRFGEDFEVSCGPISITITSGANPSIIAPPPICQGSSFNFSDKAVGPGITWYDQDKSTIISPAVPAGPGSYTYYVSSTNGSCESERVPYPFNVVSTPAAPGIINSNPSICPGASFDFSSQVTGTGINWYDGTNLITPTVPGTPGGYTYYLSSTENSCEGPKSSFLFTVSPPSAGPSISTANICLGATFDFSSVLPGGSLKWYDESSNLITPSVPASQGSYTFYVINNNNGCESAKSSFTLTVSPPQTAPTNSSASICVGSPFDFSTVLPDGSLKWYDASSNLITPSVPTSPGDYTFYFTNTVSGCQTEKAVFSLNIKPSLEPNVVSNTTVCQNGQLDLSTKVSGNEIKWYDANGSIAKPTTFPTLGPFTYFVTNTLNGCESVKVKFDLTVQGPPSTPGAIDISLCLNELPIDLTTKVQGDQITWYASYTSTTPIATPSVPNNAGIYKYYFTNTVTGCESPKAELKVTVNAAPAVPGIVKTNICQGTSFDLSTAVLGNLIKWYETNESISPIALPAVPSDEGSYTYFVSNTKNGCESPRIIFNFKVLKAPAPILSSGTITYCQYGKADSLSEAITIAGDYHWYANATGTAAPASMIPSTNLPGSVNYFVSQISGTCESERVQLTITVNPTPKLSATVINLVGAETGDLSKAFSDINNTVGTEAYWKNIALTDPLTLSEAQAIASPGTYYVKKTAGSCSAYVPIKVTATDRKNQTITFLALPSKTFGDQAFKLSASSSEGLPISFSSSDINIATIIGDTLFVKAAGSVLITASQSGDKVVNPASDVSQVLTIKKAAQKITIVPVGVKNLNDPAFQLSVSSNSALTNFKYLLIIGPVALTADGIVTPSSTTSGSVVIKVSQVGDKNFLPTDTTISFQVISAVIASKTLPTVIPFNASSGISLTTKTGVTIDEVLFYFKKITDVKWDSLSMGNSSAVYAPLLTDKVDEIGIHYYFKVTYNTSSIEYTEKTIAYTDYTLGLDIAIKGGANQTNYQIIAMPLLLKGTTVGNVFNELGAYNKTKWRLFQYNNKTNKELSLSDSIFPGKGYWLISRNPVTINTGRGIAVKVTETESFKIQLKKGYNQIGNPYNFPISWDHIYHYNGSPAGLDDQVKLFTKTGWFDSTHIPTFQGAYVFAENDVEIKIPAQKLDGLHFRKSSPNTFTEGWKLDLAFSDNTGFKGAGAIGMRPDASMSKDAFDEITLPRFMKYLEINFHHPEYFAPKFSHDIIKEKENHIWNFSLESNSDEANLSFSWDPSSCRNQSKEFYLLDLSTGIAINMKEKASYSISHNATRNLRIYYGDQSFIDSAMTPEQTIVHEPFPNPFSESTSLSYSLSASHGKYQVELNVYDLLMQKIATLENNEKTAGYYQTEWNGTNASGQKLPAGVYFIKIKIAGDGYRDEWVKKVVLN